MKIRLQYKEMDSHDLAKFWKRKWRNINFLFHFTFFLPWQLSILANAILRSLAHAILGILSRPRKADITKYLLIYEALHICTMETIYCFGDFRSHHLDGWTSRCASQDVYLKTFHYCYVICLWSISIKNIKATENPCIW